MTFEQKEGSIQQNMVTFWHGSIDNIPAGWVYCDGNNGTPDMRDSYAKTVPYDGKQPGDTGGANTYALSVSQLPSHSHNVDVQDAGSHTHTKNTGNAYTSDPYTSNITDGTGTGIVTDYQGSHTHSLYVDDTGGNASIDNRPASQEMHFIMRL